MFLEICNLGGLIMGNKTYIATGNGKITTKVKVSISIGTVVVVLGIVFFVFLGGLPNGTYTLSGAKINGEYVDASSPISSAYSDYSIIVDGKDFGIKMSGITQKGKYTYKNGVVSVKGVDGVSTDFNMEYDKDKETLLWNISSGVVLEFKKE
jgi:hypothetical protein